MPPEIQRASAQEIVDPRQVIALRLGNGRNELRTLRVFAIPAQQAMPRRRCEVGLDLLAVDFGGEILATVPGFENLAQGVGEVVVGSEASTPIRRRRCYRKSPSTAASSLSGCR